MELNEISTFKEAFQTFGGIPNNTIVESVHVNVLDQFLHYLEPKNSRVFMLPYYGLSILQDVTDDFELNDTLLDRKTVLAAGVEAMLSAEEYNCDEHYRGCSLYIQELISRRRSNTDKVNMHHYDDFLIYAEDETGYWELWFHKSGDGSCARVEKYIPFEQWVKERSESFIGLSFKPVPNKLYEITGENLTSKFEW